MPATWRVGKLTQEAASTPDELTLNSAAFDDPLLLKLESGQRSEAQRLRGLNIWGLFDLERGRFINREREWLPLGSYVLISSEKFDNILRKGFDEEEYPANDPYELEDGTTCFVTRLWPTDKYGTLSLTQGEKTWELNFRPSAKIEARFFIEEGAYASNFSRIKGLIRIEELPILCVAIPFGYFINTESVLKSKFQVFVDEMPGYGQWERRHADDDREFYIWRWANRPVMKESPPCNLNSFKKVNLKDFEPPDLTGRRTISIKAPELGFKFEYQVEILKRQPNIDWCWNNLPGDYLLWFLLEQSTEGMKWDDLLLAKDIIAPNSKLSYLLLREYAKYGLIRRQGQIWQIAESRAVLKRLSTSDLNMQFCGKPSVLWGLIRYMRDSIIRKKTQKKTPHQYGFRHIPSLSYSLPLIQVVNDKDELPFLLMRFRENSKGQVEDYLRWHNVRIVSNLWRC